MNTSVIRRKRTFVVKQGKACAASTSKPTEAPGDTQASQKRKARAEPENTLKTPEKATETDTPPKKKKKPRKRVFDTAQEGIDLLIEHWPALFSDSDPKPLKVGIGARPAKLLLRHKNREIPCGTRDLEKFTLSLIYESTRL